MPTLAEIAPDLAPYLTEQQAEQVVTATATGPAPAPKITDLADLPDKSRQLLLLWLKWYGAKRIPLVIASLDTLMPNTGRSQPALTKWFLRHGPKEVARKLNLDEAFLRSLISQVAAIRSEVGRGTDAWMPAAVTPTIASVVLDAPAEGDVTITGADFDSYETRVTRVRLERPDVGGVTLDQTEIEAGGGRVTATEIVVPGAMVPGGGLRSADEITVRADGLVSAIYVVPVP